MKMKRCNRTANIFSEDAMAKSSAETEAMAMKVKEKK
jgi:hypothetical protein